MISVKGWHRLTSENENLPMYLWKAYNNYLIAKTQKLRWYMNIVATYSARYL